MNSEISKNPKKVNYPTGPTTYVLDKNGMTHIVRNKSEDSNENQKKEPSKKEVKKDTPKKKEKVITLRQKKIALDMLTIIQTNEDIVLTTKDELDTVCRYLHIIINS